jgi:hypothetical protein
VADVSYVQLDPGEHRPVQVQLDDGRWVDGWLEAQRKVEGVWSAFVRYSTAPSETYLGWFEEGRVRAVGGGDGL